MGARAGVDADAACVDEKTDDKGRADMNYENVRTEMDGELLIVTLHRPEKRNAMTQQMRVDLLDCARAPRPTTR